MELDPRLQNISAAELQEFGVPHYPNFDQGYQSALYDNGLSEDHGASAHPHPHPHPHPHSHPHPHPHPHAHPHTQAYAQFVTAANEPRHFPGSGTSATQRRSNNATVSRARNVNAQNLNRSPVSTRQSRQHITQQSGQPVQAAQFNNNPFTSPTNTVRNNGRLPPAPITSSASSSPLAQRTSARPRPTTQPQPPPPLPPPQAQPPPPQPESTAQQPDPSQFTHPSTFPLIPNPPNLSTWREKFFNITEPLLLTSDEYHTYFPHVDNIYSHRSTQKYKKKPFVSHYWDCRLKGRPTGTPLSKLRARKEGRLNEDDDEGPAAHSTTGTGATTTADGDEHGADATEKEIKKRKRKTRERDLCDVKIKVTEFFGRDELEALGKLDLQDQNGDDALPESSGRGTSGQQLTFVLEDGSAANVPASGGGQRMSGAGQGGDDAMSFGVLEPLKKLPEGHPGTDGKRWYMIQRVNGSGKDDDDASLDHKHTMEESDRIKKNSVQRWLLAQEKERKKQHRTKNTTEPDSTRTSRGTSVTSTPSFHASGKAQQTAKSHAAPASTQLTFYANSFCPFAQRVWIALELKGIAYQYVEVTPSQVKDGKCTIPGVLEVCPQGITPLLRHGNWAVWESDVILEYLEDLSIGHSLLPLGEPQLRAHSRLWKDHINRKVLPYFYVLLLLPASETGQPDGQPSKPTVAERQSVLMATLQSSITELVNASHASGPFFLGTEISFVDVAFAPWIIRLSRVLEYYREFPKPEVGTRWKAWVDAIESNDAVRRTVSDDKSYHAVYGGIGRDALSTGKIVSSSRGIAEMRYAQSLIRQEGFGLGGDMWGTLSSANPPGVQRS